MIVSFTKSKKEDRTDFVLRFDIPHLVEGKECEGFAASLQFPDAILKKYEVSDPEKLPSWIWMEKLHSAFSALALLIEHDNSNKKPLSELGIPA